MNDDEFDNYLNSCFQELEEKQQYLIDNYGFGSFDRFTFDFEKEEIYFSKDNEKKVRAKIIPIGSYNTATQTWMWGWANDAFPDKLREKSSKLKGLESLTGFEIFGNEMAEIDEDMTWEIAGMALNFLNAPGVYRGPSNNTMYFYTLDEIENIGS